MFSFNRAIVVLLPLTVMLTWAAPALGQGPLVLMGIDAEDGGPGGHGPISVYESVLTNGTNTGILDNVSNGGSGILLIGGTGFSVPAFWSQISSDLSVTVTTVTGAGNIASQSFAGFAMIAVSSDQFNTGGGLTNAENDALAARSNDVASFVNGGGGLLGFSSAFLNNPYGYLGNIGTFTFATPPQYSNITPTAAGLAIGITDVLDVCCWHDEYITFPSFLNVLATNANTGNAAAIGGLDVVLPGQVSFDDASLLAFNEPGSDHTVTVTVVDEDGDPIVGVTVDFTVVNGPNAGAVGAVNTDGSGQASFTYTSNGDVGVDEIEACFDDPNDDPDEGEICTTLDALKFWDEDCNENGIPDTCDIDCDGFDTNCQAFDDCGLSSDDDGNGIPDECCVAGAVICEVDDDEITVLLPPGVAPGDVVGGRITMLDGVPVNIPAVAIDDDCDCDDDNGDDDESPCVELDFEDLPVELDEGIEVCVELDLVDGSITCETCFVDADDDDDDDD